MNNFNYTARDTSGATKRGSVKAADRSAALQAIKAQGLVPVSVAEGAAQKEAFKLNVPPRTLMLAGAAVILVIGALFLMQGRKPAVGKQKPEVIKAAKGIPAKKEVSKIAGSMQPATNRVAEIPLAPVPSLQESAPAATPQEKLAAGTPPKEQRPNMRIVEAVEGMSTNPPPADYESGTERVINMIANARLGNPPPPLLNLPPGENITNILNRDIVVYDTDSKQTEAEKTNVAYVKQLIKDYMKDGGTPETFLKYYHAELTKAFEERNAVQKYTADLIKAGDQKGALKYMEEANKELTKKGMRPITIPPGLQ